MITPELARKLKNAGFPQKEDTIMSWEELQKESQWNAYMYSRRIKGHHSTFDSSVLPEENPQTFEHGKHRPTSRFSREYLDSEEGKEYTVYFPTLSELIEACGKNFMSLRKVWNENGTITNWIAESDTDEILAIISSSPEEAVGQLWLTLNQ